ncbi:MAG: roadblock/LC7 domain-containing protein [Gemmatimonadaceae bacterium]|nr:roadblock/LC7 domain-containing protein [Gemmatimonadaceae bacterium]
MPTIRDLVSTLRQFDGVQAAAVLGRDGLLIDSEANAGVDSEQIAAHVPSILQFADDLGGAAQIGALRTAVLEHVESTVVLSTLSAEVVLLVQLTPTANLGALLYDLRRHRAGLATLV